MDGRVVKGAVEGTNDGAGDGRFIGYVVGWLVGAKLGRSVGSTVGFAVGDTDCDTEGRRLVGELMDATVGTIEGVQNYSRSAGAERQTIDTVRTSVKFRSTSWARKRVMKVA